MSLTHPRSLRRAPYLATSSSRPRRFPFAALLLLCLACLPSRATVFVKPSGSNAYDGSSWARAKPTVQAGLTAAASGDDVWVAQGTYKENITTVRANVSVYGGFFGNEGALDDRKWYKYETVLDGKRAGTVVSANAANVLFDGFTLRNGTGSGVSCSGGTITLSHCNLTGNSASFGGGIHCVSGGVNVINSSITGSSASSGGGVYCDAGPGTITITNCTITGNSAKDAGGAFCAAGVNGAGTINIYNSIVAFNSSGISRSYSGFGIGNVTLKSNDVFGNTFYNYSNLPDPVPSGGNLSVDPLLSSHFTRPHLQPGSPLVDKGDDSFATTGQLDTDGQPRKNGSHVDIGADESDGMDHKLAFSIWYVSSAVFNDFGDGKSWPTAKQTIPSALALAQGDDQVWVRKGTYGLVNVPAGVCVYGGFAGNETALGMRDWKSQKTILDGYKTGPVVTAVNQGIVVDGLTIQNGISDGSAGGGVYCSPGDIKIANCTLTGNRARTGGAIYCYQGGVSIANSALTNNTANVGSNGSVTGGGGGGGVYCASGTLTITNCTLTGNTANTDSNGQGGGGVNCDSGSSASITNTIFTGNFAPFGGGLNCSAGSSVTISNCAFIRNTAVTVGGGVSCTGGSVGVVNATFTNNSNAVDCQSGTANIANTIVAFNASGVALDGGTETLNHCDVSHNTSDYPGFASSPTGQNGNISIDPLFVSPPDAGTDGTYGNSNDRLGNLHLSAASPVRDAGDNSFAKAGDADLDGKARSIGPAVDMGAYEFDPNSSPFSMTDVRNSLKITGGLSSALVSDVARLDVAGSGTPMLSLPDAFLLARKVAGLEPNP